MRRLAPGCMLHGTGMARNWGAEMLRRGWLCAMGALLFANVASAQSPLKPLVPEGRDPGGIPIALLGPGVDYTDPDIAAHLARRDNGQILGADDNASDGLPFESATSRLGAKFARALLSRVPNSRLIPVRLKTEGSAPGTKFVPLNDKSVELIGRHARIAVYIIADGKSNTNSKPDPLPIDIKAATIARNDIVTKSATETVFMVNHERTFMTKFSDAHPGALPLFVLGVGPGALNAGDLWTTQKDLGFCKPDYNPLYSNPLARCGPLSSTFIVVAAADKSGKLRRIPEALAQQVDFGVVTSERRGASELASGAPGDMEAVLRLLEIVAAFPERTRKTPQSITQQLLKIATQNSGSVGPKFGILQ